jgi:hypothetical protein
MLNDFLPNSLLKEEIVKRDWLLSNVEKDDTWVGASASTGNGGNLIVPFKGAGASSIAAGSLSASNDIAEDAYIRGQISTQPEIWGSMIFQQRDLMEHDKVSELNFLKILPDSVDDFMEYMKGVVSVNLLNGVYFAQTTAAYSSTGGVLNVDRPDRFQINQKVQVDTTTSVLTTGYVSAIDMNALTVTLVTARGGSTNVDFSTNTVASGANIYNDGFKTNGMSPLPLMLLSAANGGNSTIYGQTKTAYPYLQAININGASVTAANLVEKIFDGFTLTRRLGKGMPNKVVMSYNNFGVVMKIIEASKGAFNVVANTKKTSQYGWTEIKVGSVTSTELTLVGVQEMADTVIMYLDMRSLKFYSNGFFKKRKSPDGIEYFEIRATTGFQYIVDICLFGDLVCNRPSYNGIMYNISIAY